MIEKDEFQKKHDDQKEEIDYYSLKVAKIEAENKALRLGKDQNKRVRELEEEVESLKSQSNNFRYQEPKESTSLKSMAAGKDLSKDEQMKL